MVPPWVRLFKFNLDRPIIQQNPFSARIAEKVMFSIPSNNFVPKVPSASAKHDTPYFMAQLVAHKAGVCVSVKIVDGHWFT